MNDKLTPRKQRVWRSFLSVSVQTMELLDQELAKHGQLSLTDYEILVALAESDEQRLRMSDLARQVLVSRSRLTYRVDRLAEVEYVTREECEDDRRGLWATLTATGTEAFQQATERHHQAIETLFFDAIGDDEFDVIDDVMSRLDAKLGSRR